MKVIFAIPDMGSGGAERVISIISQELSARGIDVKIMMFFGERIHYNLPPNVNICSLRLNRCTFLNRLRKLRRNIKNLKIEKNEQIIIFAFHDSVLKYLLAARMGINNISVVACERNNPYIKGKSLFARLKAIVPYYLADHAVFQTNDARKYYSWLANRKCSVIPNPISPSKSKWKADLNSRRIISVCRLHAQKNIPMTLAVISRLKETYPDIHLDIYGEGPLKDNILQKIEHQGLSDFVTLKGVTKDVTKVLSESSVFISTSNFEGISNSMLEAMSVGMPIVCTDCPIGGARMMLSDGCGELSPIKDDEAFAASVANILENKAYAERLATAAAQKALQYSPSKISEEWLMVGKK